ncbi:MAG: 3'-5' exonuclease [Bacteroidaceae bacterium]|jgi:ribonuclease D
MIIHTRIPKEALHDMPTASFSGVIHVIDSTAQLAGSIDFLSRQARVGIDSETRPSFQKGRLNKVSLLQVSTLDECFLFRLGLIENPELLVRFLEDERIKKIGLSLKDDSLTLHRRFDFTPGGWVDLQDIVGAFRIEERSLQKIYAILFNERISKRQRLSNWEAPELTAAQQAYAALDAYACLRIYNCLHELRISGNYIIKEIPPTQPSPETVEQAVANPV